MTAFNFSRYNFNKRPNVREIMETTEPIESVPLVHTVRYKSVKPIANIYTLSNTNSVVKVSRFAYHMPECTIKFNYKKDK